MFNQFIMKHFKSLIALLAITVFTLTSCNKVEKPEEGNGNQKAPEITLQAKGSTTTSISFEITPAYGEQCAYMLLANQEIPSAQEIIANGVSVSAGEATTHTISDLTPDTYYNVIAAIYGNEQYVTSQTLSIKTQKEDQPDNPVDDTIPTVEINYVSTTTTSISFSVTSADAERCAYIMFDGSAPDAETIISTGEEVEANKTNTISIENLTSSTTYTVIAAAYGNEKYVASEVLTITTKDEQPPVDENAIEFEEIIEGRWYSGNNYYVGMRGIGGQVLYLDIYSSTGATQNGTILPQGNYYLTESGSGTLGYTDCYFQDSGSTTTERFKSANLDVTYVGTKYRLDIEFTLKNSGETFTAYYVGKLPYCNDPEGGNTTETDLLRINSVTSTSINFTVTSEPGRDWRCVVIEKATYDMYPAEPDDFVNTFGFFGNGPVTYDWANGTEPIEGMPITISAGMDYVLIAGYYSYSTNSITSEVSMITVRTKTPDSSSETIEVEILSIESNRVEYKCTPSSGVFKYRTCVFTQEIVDQMAELYDYYGYSSYEAMMQYMIESTASNSQLFYDEQTTAWGGLISSTDYCICNLLYDNNGATRIEVTEFKTL